MVILYFVCWVAVIALVSSFMLALMQKWSLIEWLQVHAPNEFLYELFSCKFCLSWWVCVIISLTLCVATGRIELLAAPLCATNITRQLW